MTNQVDAKLGQNLKRLREAVGLEVSALADRLGVAPLAVIAWEEGLSRIDAQTLIALCESLDIEMADFFQA